MSKRSEQHRRIAGIEAGLSAFEGLLTQAQYSPAKIGEQLRALGHDHLADQILIMESTFNVHIRVSTQALDMLKELTNMTDTDAKIALYRDALENLKR